MRILSYNVMAGKRIDRIVDWLNRLPDYDVLCFQEFPKEKIRECMTLLGRRPYGYRFTPSISLRNTVLGQMTLFRKDRLSIVKSTVVSLGINALERSVLHTKVPRSALITTYQTASGRFVVVNVHVVAWARNLLKYKQVDTIIHALNRYTDPVIIVGDFNISSLAGKKRLFRLMADWGFTGTNKKMATHRVAIFRHQFDYVFTRGAELQAIWPYRVKFSDHFPVHVTGVFRTSHPSARKAGL